MKLVWCPEIACKAFIDTVKTLSKDHEEEEEEETSVAELISAMAGGWNARLIVETWPSSSVATSVGLGMARAHTGGRHVCVVGDERAAEGYKAAGGRRRRWWWGRRRRPWGRRRRRGWTFWWWVIRRRTRRGCSGRRGLAREGRWWCAAAEAAAAGGGGVWWRAARVWSGRRTCRSGRGWRLRTWELLLLLLLLVRR
ncbi:hypothetical protein Sjap_020549 [Stephania japonica]|uniref:Uncharacterized protein n=1 Tax=Stephania japonica TaxID=461633 RepID=A0AAP0F3K7_9MAGN